MNHTLTITGLLLMSAFVGPPTNAQTSEGEFISYAKDGLAFRYPVGWVITDKSTAEAQHLIVSREGSAAFIEIIGLRDLVSDAGQFASLRKRFTQPLIESLSKKFGTSSSTAAKSACVDISGRKAFGDRWKGVYDKQPSTSEVYSFVMGLRFITLVYVRSDQDEAEGNIAWRVTRDSLNIDKVTTATGQSPPGFEGFFGGGILNGKVLVLPRPEYPAFARSARLRGPVEVQVTVDEKGEVIAARATSGHQMLREASVDAARRAKFAPTLLCGEAVKVTGILTYNF